MKDGPKAEPSGTVVEMRTGVANGGWAEGGTFGDGDVNAYELEMDWE